MSFSYWEQNTFIKSPDVTIIGSGIVGLNAAIALKKKSPKLHVLILERSMLPYGASTRNAGFACYGSVSELLGDLENETEENVFALVERRWRGLQQLRQLVGDDKLKFEALGGYEVFTPNDKVLFEQSSDAIERFNVQLEKITGIKNIYRQSDSKIKQFGFNNVEHLIENSGEGQVDTGIMMQSLLSIARELGVEVLNGANVNEIKDDETHATISLTEPIDNSVRLINSKRVIICVNGFARKFLPGFDINPARAQVLITSPIPSLKIRGTFHYDHGYYYFRNIDNRILFGGGRNLDFKGETTEDMRLTEQIQKRLEDLLSEMILPGEKYSVEMRWSGIMGLGAAKSPIIKKTGANIFCAVRMGGMGVAIGTLVGNEVSELALESL